MIIDQAYIEKIKQAKIHLNTHSTGAHMGSKRSKAKGSALEFSDFRDYVPGDDIRRLDWHAYARLEKLLVKLFMEEREAHVHLFLDHSGSMGLQEKGQTLIRASAALAYFALTDYDTVSCYSLLDAKALMLSNLRGLPGFYRAVADLEQLSFGGTAETYKQVHLNQNRLSKGLSVIVSDFLNLGDLEATLKLLAYKKQAILLIHIWAEENVLLKHHQSMSLVDAETGKTMTVVMSPSMIKRYEQACLDHETQLKTLAGKYQGHYVAYGAHWPFEQFLSHMGKKGGF